MSKILVPVELLQEIASYLARQPWREVHHLIAGLDDATRHEPDAGDDRPPGAATG